MTPQDERWEWTSGISPEAIERAEGVLVDLIRAIVRDELAKVVSATRGESPRKWLTVAEAATRLGCSRDAIRMRVRRGRLEAKRQGRTVYVSSDSVEGLG
jgi:excisionase family DNA binding protein